MIINSHIYKFNFEPNTLVTNYVLVCMLIKQPGAVNALTDKKQNEI